MSGYVSVWMLQAMHPPSKTWSLTVSGLGPQDDPDRYPDFTIVKGTDNRALLEDGLARLKAVVAYLQAEYDRLYPPATLEERLGQIEDILEDT